MPRRRAAAAPVRGMDGPTRVSSVPHRSFSLCQRVLTSRTPTSFTTARRPRTRTPERLQAWPQVHPGVARGTRGGSL